MSGWTPERVAQAKALWKSGKRASEIGKTLGISRHAVLGKLFREGVLGLTEAERSRRQSDSQKGPKTKAWWESMRLMWARKRRAREARP